MEERSITIFPDYERGLPLSDPDNHELFISLGCALENLLIAASHFGYYTDIEMNMEDPFKESNLVNLSPGNVEKYDTLFKNIEIRQSTRNKYNRAVIPPADIQKLQEAGVQDQVVFQLFIDPGQIAPIIDITKRATEIQLPIKNL